MSIVGMRAGVRAPWVIREDEYSLPWGRDKTSKALPERSTIQTSTPNPA
jgi:hypothetical protein